MLLFNHEVAAGGLSVLCRFVLLLFEPSHAGFHHAVAELHKSTPREPAAFTPTTYFCLLRSVTHPQILPSPLLYQTHPAKLHRTSSFRHLQTPLSVSSASCPFPDFRVSGLLLLSLFQDCFVPPSCPQPFLTSPFQGSCTKTGS